MPIAVCPNVRIGEAAVTGAFFQRSTEDLRSDACAGASCVGRAVEAQVNGAAA